MFISTDKFIQDFAYFVFTCRALGGVVVFTVDGRHWRLCCGDFFLL